MVEPKRQRIRDPVHNVVEFDEGDPLERTLWRVIQAPAFQRLRRIRQLGFSDLVYPGATHSRFAHSIGVFHTARRLMGIVEQHVPRRPSERLKREAALAAALVHDIGHGPFSHAFEQVGKAMKWPLVADHEEHSQALIRDQAAGAIGDILDRYSEGFADQVAEVIRGRTASVYRSVVSSQFDADRLDYIRRDKLMTGTGLGGIDFEWLIANLAIEDVAWERRDHDGRRVGVRTPTFVLGAKALHAAEAYVTGLFQMYPNVYFHKTTRGAEKLMQALLSRLWTAAAEGRVADTGLPATHPLMRLARENGSIAAMADMDDFVIWGALPLLREAADPKIADASDRLWRRRLLKCRDPGALLARRLQGQASDAAAGEFERVSKTMKDEVLDWLDQPGHEGRVLIDEASRAPYKQVEDEGPLNQIWIRDGDGLVDLAALSPAVSATRPWRLFRLYVEREDEEAGRFVEDLITRSPGSEA